LSMDSRLGKIRHSDFVIFSHHSVRIATMGSTRVARRAGNQQAISATTASANRAKLNERASNPPTPYSTLRNPRPAPIAPRIPIIKPARTSNIPCDRTRRKTSARYAPSARRMPSSRVRWVTVSAITPYNPTLASTSAITANSPSSDIIM
jgi:hypothetical protein